jgi:diacylglycerol O-acyltransferase / wax synthase
MERMSLLDAAFLYVENDVTPMQIGGVAILEGPPPTHDELAARFAAMLSLVPRYRQKVHFPPLNVGLPSWIDDPHFNLDYHLRRSAVPSPGGRSELETLVGREMSQHLDRARPLWEMSVVEGLEDGRWAMVSKVHHCMVDGVASTDLMSLLFDVEPNPPAVTVTPWRPRPEPSMVGALTHAAAGAMHPVRAGRRAVEALRSPAAVAERGFETARALASFAPKLKPPPTTSLNGPYGPHRRWTSANASLADVKLVRRRLGGTVNDVVLAAITRGFRDLVVGRGEQVDGRVIRTMVPVSVRAEHERGAYNNRVSGVLVDFPVGVADPAARLAEIRRQMDGIKESRGAVAGERLVNLADFAPPVLLAAGTRLAASMPQRNVNTAATNVPGPQHPLYFAGRRLLESAPTIPLAASLRVVVGIFSYDGQLHFGITGDYDTAADIGVLAQGIERGMAELVAAATPAEAAPATTAPATAPATAAPEAKAPKTTAHRKPRSRPSPTRPTPA